MSTYVEWLPRLSINVTGNATYYSFGGDIMDVSKFGRLIVTAEVPQYAGTASNNVQVKLYSAMNDYSPTTAWELVDTITLGTATVSPLEASKVISRASNSTLKRLLRWEVVVAATSAFACDLRLSFLGQDADCSCGG